MKGLPATRPAGPARFEPRRQRRRLRNEVALILVLKVVGLYLLFVMFFSTHPGEPDPAAIGRHILENATLER